MSEAVLHKMCPERVDFTPTVAKTAGEVVQLGDGRAAVVATDLAIGELGVVYVLGEFDVAKTADMVVLDGQPLYWDAANSKVKYEGDFYVGCAVEDALEAATTVKVELNVQFAPDIRLGEGEWIAVETLGLGVTKVNEFGKAVKLAFDAVAEAATAALYSEKTIAIADKPILEGHIAVYDIGDDAALDVNVGMANGSHATDFDSVTEQVTIHFDGTALSILAESDDGTTEEAAADTTVDAVDDTYFFLQIDARDPADVQIYINGVNVLPAKTYALADGTGPMLAILHMEKTSNDTLADVRCKDLWMRRGRQT